MYTFLGFILVCWLLASPGWRVFALRRHNEDGVRTRVNGWLASWFAMSLLAAVCWILLYAPRCKIKKLPDPDQFICPWRHVDTYMKIVIASALISNVVWLMYLCFIDLKKTLVFSGISAATTCMVAIAANFQFGVHGCWGRLRLAGGMAVGLASIANFCRFISMGRGPQEFSLLALSVALAAVLPEVMWILNVICVERYTEEGHKCGFWGVFLNNNFFWKLSWTRNSIIRLPELIALVKQIDVQRIIQWRHWIITRVRRLFVPAPALAQGRESSV